MSKIGKKPITIPDKVQVEYKNGLIYVKGPLGNLDFKIPDHLIDILIENQSVLVKQKNNSKLARSLQGTFRSLINNMIIGVTSGYSKTLVIEGIGYKAALEGGRLKLDVGYSHSVYIDIPKDIRLTVEKNTITISGIDKQLIGNFAYQIKKVRIPDAYKGKGIRFSTETLKLKPGKKVGAATTAA